MKDEEKISEFDFGNGCKEIRFLRFSPETKYKISNFKKLDEDHYVNTETGEVSECERAETKYDSLKSVRKSMIARRRRLSFNINPCLKTGNCFYVTLTMDKETPELRDLDNILKKLIRAIQYRYPEMKYAAFKEISYRNFCLHRKLYHVHTLFWCNKPMTEGEQAAFKAFIDTKWKGGYVKEFCKVYDFKNLNNILFYLCNYSGNSIKAHQKRETLKCFPSGYHTAKESKGLKKPTAKVTDNFTPKSQPISYSEPKAAHGHLSLAIYIDEDEREN